VGKLEAARCGEPRKPRPHRTYFRNCTVTMSVFSRNKGCVPHKRLVQSMSIVRTVQIVRTVIVAPAVTKVRLFLHVLLILVGRCSIDKAEFQAYSPLFLLNLRKHSKMQVRRAEFDDCKELSELIMQTGGVSIYKATFGTYNLSSMIENSYLSIMSSHNHQTGEEDGVRSAVSFMSINDGLSVISTDPDAYNKVMHTISHYIPATVKKIVIVLSYTRTDWF